ncbi:hypothetical protein CDN99_18495 [Roseateles aquatilis]|uniref:Uncharacterized protein n=1 Tax=Roseateles aquatilis TaxID=431061 RepID=A0A246J5R2_9BURK|nr:hypothetical protein [Roseateles aquatilis]OWQ87584.1 hypothetical protein CDN99_18495 [Roseateles aquatilis]
MHPLATPFSSHFVADPLIDDGPSSKGVVDPPSTSGFGACADGATSTAPATPSPPSDAALIDEIADALSVDAREQTGACARHLTRGLDLLAAPGSPAAQADRFIVDGDPEGLPADLRQRATDALDGDPDRDRPCGRLRALITTLVSAFGGASQWLDARPVGRTVLNLAHCAVRSVGSVALPTMARQGIGRALDLAMSEGLSETARTVMSCACLAVPAVGQAVLLVRDERRGEATGYSRATRVVLMALPTAAGALGLASGTLLNAGTRFAEVVLYPLMRDAVQARWPMATQPDSGPTRGSLALTSLGYAINQLAVSRAFAVAPDVDLAAGAVLTQGVVARGVANWAGEAVDLWSLLMLHHACRHGLGTQPRTRVGTGSATQAMTTMRHWDTMAARGAFVAGFNQLYDSLLAENTLTRAWRPSVGDARAFQAADWTTEGIVGGLTVLTYGFWTDPLHARGATLQTLDEAHRGERAPRQYAGNRAEPAVAGLGMGTVELVAYRDAADRRVARA